MFINGTFPLEKSKTVRQVEIVITSVLVGSLLSVMELILGAMTVSSMNY